MSSLPIRHQKFVNEYLKEPNGTQAAIRAGFSPKGAEVTASRLLRNTKVAAEIASRQKKLDEKADLEAARVRTDVSRLLNFDPRTAFNADGTTKKIHEMPADVAMAIAGIEADDASGEIRRVRFVDRVRVLELAAKILGMLKFQVTGKGGEPLFPPAPKIDFSGFSMSELKSLARRNGQGAA